MLLTPLLTPFSLGKIRNGEEKWVEKVTNCVRFKGLVFFHDDTELALGRYLLEFLKVTLADIKNGSFTIRSGKKNFRKVIVG